MRDTILPAYKKQANLIKQSPFLDQEIAERLLDRLNFVRHNPKRILDIGTGFGTCLSDLKARYPHADIYACDISLEMLSHAQKNHSIHRFIAAQSENMPFQAGCFDLIISNCHLLWHKHFESSLKELKSLLSPNGLLLFSTYGPDTLIELRQSWANALQQSLPGLFQDMHILGDSLKGMGFNLPVVDRELLTLTYPSLEELYTDLREMVVTDLIPYQGGLFTPRQWEKVQQSYQDSLTEDSRYPVSIEIIYGLAWQPQTYQSTPHEYPLKISQVE